MNVMDYYYTDEQNTLVLIALLKEFGISKVIASPGSTNAPFVVSMQNDSYFEMYSSVDERSAAYMACGLAEESGEPVILSCTGATASRNYLPGLTEAFYRKLPILAITSTQAISKIGHHNAQIIDRSVIPNDVANLSVTLPIVKDENDLWECEVNINKAILELTRHGGGPVHINLTTRYSKSYDIMTLPKVRKIERITVNDCFPELPQEKIAIFIGAHSKISKELSESIDRFCGCNDAVVFCDHTSNYKGKYRVLYSLAAGQQMFHNAETIPNILIHIGEITGDYYSLRMVGAQVWRVNEDGEIRDTYRKQRYIFQMSEIRFFDYYSENNGSKKDDYLKTCKNHLSTLYKKFPEIPFSNIWIASKMAHLIPENSTIHFGILNSLRSWNFFEMPLSVSSASNVGGFGIDGGVSSLIGASLANTNKLYFGVIGDLAFFYDMNVLGNHHLRNNVRILLINNGKGVEFRLFNYRDSKIGDDLDKFTAAGGHFGNKSRLLVKHYAEDLGFEYISASNKEEFNDAHKRFLTSEMTDKPILFEIFTDGTDESDALEAVLNIEENVHERAKQFVTDVLGTKGINLIKKVVKR